MIKSSDQYQYIDSKEAKQYLEVIEVQLKNKFKEIRSQKYCPNTKGYDYEDVLKTFFEFYLSGGFEFFTRVGILDNQLKVNKILKPIENEFDVVAIYKKSVPRIVMHRSVPYDSVAFITEVKQTLTLQTLKDDLAKLDKLSKLPNPNNRVGMCSNYRVFSGFELGRPMRILFYYELKAKIEKVFDLLEGVYAKSWDICIILSEDIVFLNSTLPYVRHRWKKASFARNYEYSLLKGIFYTCAFIEGDYIDSWAIFWNLFRSLVHKE